MPLYIDVGVVSKCKCHGFDDNIVDADFSSVLFLIFIEFCSEFKDGVHLDGLGNIVVRHGLF